MGGRECSPCNVDTATRNLTLLWPGSSGPRENPRDKFLHARKYASHNFIHASRVRMEPIQRKFRISLHSFEKIGIKNKAALLRQVCKHRADLTVIKRIS